MDNEYKSPLRQALDKGQDVDVPAGVNFLNQTSAQLTNTQTPLELLKDFRNHLDRRIAELEPEQRSQATPCNGPRCTDPRHRHAESEGKITDGA